MIIPQEDPVVIEVTATLREWHKIWISLYLDNQIDLFERIEAILVLLIDARAELIAALRQQPTGGVQDASTSRNQQIIELKTNIVNKLDLGNRLLNLDLVPRDTNSKIVNPVELSPVKLYKLHSEATIKNAAFFASSSQSYQESAGAFSTLSTISQASSESNYESINTQSNSTPNSYHLQMSLKGHFLAALPPDELVEVYFSIVEAFPNNLSTSFKHVTEKFLVQMKNDEIVRDCLPNTIFANLGPLTNRELCLYVQVYRIGKMTLVDGHRTTFGKQPSNHNLQVNQQNGSSTSISNASKFSNGLSRNRHSTIGGFFNTLPNYKRPFGATMITLKDYTKGANFKETNIGLKIVASNELEFSQMVESYVKRNQFSKVNQNLPNIHLDLSVKFLSCTQESLSKISNLKSYCLTEKRGFPDIVMPGDFKNDLYFTLESAEFEKGGKSISKNIEASISLIDKAGLVIDKCISPGSNCDNISSHKSCVFYHSNTPKWNETIKINVPLSEFDSAHIRIEFRHCSTKDRDKKFLGFSFLPLSDQDGTVIADKSHELYLYKCESQLWEDESLNLCKYTSLPYGPAAKLQSSNNMKSTAINNFNHSHREIVTVSTFLLSTKLTQNSNLLNLLKWRELIKRNNKDFEEALKKALVLKGEEIVKFLQDILDTLFDTFTLYSTSEDDTSALIFKVLVHIFQLLDEPKYQHFKPVLDTYASAHFSATLVYKGLLNCVKKCVEYSSKVEKHTPIQRCFKTIKYVFQFIVQSKLLYSKATGEQNDEPFLNDLRHLFRLFGSMLAKDNPKLIPIQVTFLESFPGALEQLIKVVDGHELAQVVTSLVESVGRFRLPSALSKAKLIFMKETADSGLIKNRDIRLHITESFCMHLDCYIKHSEELELCHEVIEILIVKIHDYHWPPIYRLYQLSMAKEPINTSIMTVGEINIITKGIQIQANQLHVAIINVSKELEPFVNLMEPLLQLLDRLIRDFNSDQLIIQKFCTCLLTVLKLMSKISFEQFMRKRKLDYSKLCNLFRSFRAVYNRDWSVMQLTSHSILEHPIDEISRDIKLRNDNQSINRQLSSYVKLIVDFITHPTLQLEVFSDRKKNYILEVFGDLRIKFSAQLMKFWVDLTKPNIYDLIPTSIQSILDASLVPNDNLQQKLIPIFWDMIDAEDHQKSNSRQFETCLIEYLDLFMNLDRGDEEFIKNFDNILTSLIKERKPSWEQHGLRLVDLFAKLMQLLIVYRKSLESTENRSKQMSCLVELLNFYKEQDNVELHLRYLFKLSDMHLEVGNHIEAALTLKLYADQLKWCNRSLSSLDGYRPEEQEWHRKESLYQRIIDNFDLGKCWEESIALCKELASFYENFLVDYEKVSTTLKRLASFLDNILKEHRPEREYFRVEFLGTSSPDFVRGKEFIYRGDEYERLATFMQRMTAEFPDAQILNPKSRKTVTKDSDDQYMVISNVKPVPFLQEHFKSGQRNINDKIIQYYLNNRLDTFSYDMPIIKGSVPKEKSGEINVRNLWVGRYVLKVKKQLPDILPWSEVVSQDYSEISPIEHAIETITSMNLELSKLILSYKNESKKQVSPLTMRLQGVIEAAVNGGPSVFVNAFLKRQPEEVSGDSNQFEPELLIRLKNLINQQFSILDTGLALHSKLAPPEVMPLHARLVERLHNTRKTLLEDTSQIPENIGSITAHNDANGTKLGVRRTNGSLVLSSKLGSCAQDVEGAKDEVDSHDLNGNMYGEIDQIYSQPIEPPNLPKLPLLINGTKSELSSPSRQHHACETSSSLSTLAVLSNLPVNRSRISVTPSKDPIITGTHHYSSSSLSSSELCARAARKLTYDSCTRYEGGETKNSETARLSPSLNSPLGGTSSSSNQDAPPLPPRTFLSDKHSSSSGSTSRTMNRSPFYQ